MERIRVGSKQCSTLTFHFNVYVIDEEVEDQDGVVSEEVGTMTEDTEEIGIHHHRVEDTKCRHLINA